MDRTNRGRREVMSSRYSKNGSRKKSIYIWSAVAAALILTAGGAGVWFGAYASQKSLSDPPEEPSVLSVEDEDQTAEPAEPSIVEEEPQETEPVPENPETAETGDEPIAEDDQPIVSEEAEQPVDRSGYPAEVVLPEQPTVIGGILLANKQHPLPADYAPGENPEARASFERMAAAAAQEGIQLVAFSTYRSFGRQEELYEGYVAKDGRQAADRYSARPGHSEHQTGLAFDIGEAGQEQHWASTTFADTPGGKWLAGNAHDFGFILRYPEGKEKTTGYMYEAWHFRYVGKEAAKAIHEKGITLEEYLNID